MSIKVAHISATFPPHYTGTANVAANNALALQRLGHDVSVLTVALPTVPPQEAWHNIHVTRLRPLLRYGNAAFLPSLWSQITSFDLIHLHMPFYGGCEMILGRVLATPIPLVITHHQDVELSGLAGVISQVHDQIIGRAIMRSANAVCFTSLDYGRASKYRDLLNSQQIKARELPNGVDSQRFTPKRPQAEVASQFPIAGKKVILFVGVLDEAHYFKGVPLLLQAVANLQDPNLHIIIVGKGNLKTTYEKISQKLGIEQQTHFAGFVPAEQLPDVYRLADVTVLPSTTKGEAFGLVLLESLACGTPVIASDLPGVRTVVSLHQDGLLVQPGNVDALAQAIRDYFSLPYAVRKQWEENGRQKVEKTYDWDKIGRQLDALYRDVLRSD